MVRCSGGDSKEVKTKPGVFRIQTDTIARFLGEEDHPLFIAVLRRDSDFAENVRQLSAVAEEFGKDGLIVCYTLEDLLPFFTIRFGVGGTPTFLIIVSGIVLGTMLGKNSGSSLVQFIHEHLNECKVGKTMKGRSNDRKKI